MSAMRELLALLTLLGTSGTEALAGAGQVVLPQCTICVAGANGRVGSTVVRELLRSQPNVRVRALVRDADRIESYGYLSYNVGAEDGKGYINAAWQLGEDGKLGSSRIEFDEEVQGGYGLDRLEIRECELCYQKDVERAFDGVDGVIWCATAFDRGRRRLPPRVGGAVDAISRAGMGLFELRLPAPAKEGEKERKAKIEGKCVDDDGVALALKVLSAQRAQRQRIAALTGGGAPAPDSKKIPYEFVLVSAASALGYQKSLGNENGASETEFGYRKRTSESIVRSSSFAHLVVRPAGLDDVRAEENLEVLTSPGVVAEQMSEGLGAGVADDDKQKYTIHPYDVGRWLVTNLASDEAEPSGSTLEIWTSDGKF